MRFKNLIPEDPQFNIFTGPNSGGNPNGEAIGGQGDDIKPKGDDGSTDPTLPKDPPPPSADVFQVELNGKTFLLNDKGDAIDDKGNVTIPAATIGLLNLEKVKVETKAGEGEEVEIDGTVLYIRPDGAVYDKDGKVVHTKEQFDAIKQQNAPAIDWDKIYADTGLAYEEDGKPVTFTPDTEGIINYIKTVQEDVTERAIQHYHNTLAESFPEYMDILNHLKDHGTIENYVSQVDYLKIDPTTLTETQKDAIILAHRRDLGEDPDSGTAYIKYAKDAGIYDKLFENSLKNKQASQAAKASERLANEEQERAMREKSASDFFNSVTNIVKSGKLNIKGEEINIPEVIKFKDNGKEIIKSRADLIEYATKMKEFNIDGRKYRLTQYQYDTQVNNTTERVVYDMLNSFTNYQIRGIATKQTNNTPRATYTTTTKHGSTPTQNPSQSGYPQGRPILNTGK